MSHAIPTWSWGIKFLRKEGERETFLSCFVRFLEPTSAMSAKDQITKMLDQLMGQNRDGEPKLSIQ